MQQYELSLPDTRDENLSIFRLPILTPQTYNIVLRLNYDETYPYLIPISEVLIEYYDMDDAVWDMLAVYIGIANSPHGSEWHRWEFCREVADDYLNGEEYITYSDVKAAFDAGLASVYPMLRLVLDQLAEKNHMLNEVIPSVTGYEKHVDFYLICNCQPSLNYAIS